MPYALYMVNINHSPIAVLINILEYPFEPLMLYLRIGML